MGKKINETEMIDFCPASDFVHLPQKSFFYTDDLGREAFSNSYVKASDENKSAHS